MPVFRWLVLLLLVASGICFLVFAVSGKPSYKRVGFRLLFTTLGAAAVFFAALIADNLSQ